MRLVSAILFFAAALVLSASARAGDVATLEILGFSEDGGVFAFEEYGVQDGSGFPYSNRFYIDTAQDRFLPGTPIRVRIDDEGATVERARAEAKQKGQAIVADGVLAANRGYTVGANAVTEYSANPHAMSVNPRPVFPPIWSALELRLEEIPLPPPAACENLGEIKGFRLFSVLLDPDQRVQVMHDDTSIPSSRGCPLGYAIGAVQTYFPVNSRPVVVVLIAVRRFGFEGPDFRWIAVPGTIGR